MTTTTLETTPAPLPPAEDFSKAGVANFRGDVRSSLDDTKPYGPGYDGELRFIVDAYYDEDRDLTVVGFTNVPQAAAIPALRAMGFIQ